MRMTKVFKQSMEIGYLFWDRYGHDERTNEWSASEECCLFCEMIIEKASKDKCSIKEVFNKCAEEFINKINDIETELPCHMWDYYCKGFLAGEILGMPTEDNLRKVKYAEKLWDILDYGYYQEVLEEAVRYKGVKPDRNVIL